MNVARTGSQSLVLLLLAGSVLGATASSSGCGKSGGGGGQAPTPSPSGTATPPTGPSTVLWEAVSNPSIYYDEPLALASDGTTLWIAGLYSANASSDYAWRLEKRRIADGTTDASFGVGGAVEEDPGPVYADSPHTLAIDPTEDALYLSGHDAIPGYQDLEWRVEKRSRISGARVASFASNGAYVLDSSTNTDTVTASAIDVNGLYLVGQTEYYSGRTMFEALDRDTGVPYWAVVESAGAPMIFSSMALDGGALYIAGTDDIPGHFEWRIEKRSTIDGSLVTSFGTGGVIREDLGGSGPGARAIVVDGSSIFLAGSDEPAGDKEWRIEKRSATTGALDLAFGTSGVIKQNFSVSQPDTAMKLTLLGGALSGGGQLFPDGLHGGWRIERRSKNDGTLEAVTATSGASSFGFSFDDMASDGSNLYIAYLSSAGGSDLGEWRIQARTP